jgi:hypothetical protein
VTGLGWDTTTLPPPGGPVRVAREHGVADIIEFAFGMLRATYKQIVGVSVLLGLPGIVLAGIGAAQVTAGDVLGADRAAWILLGVGGVAVAIGALATEPALIDLAMARSRGEPPRIGPAALSGLRRVPGLFTVWAALFLAAALPLVLATVLSLADDVLALLFIPAVPVTLGLFLVAIMVGHLVTAAVVAERIGAWRALGRVRILLRGQFWRTFGRGLLFGFMIQVIGSVAQFGTFFGFALGEEAVIVLQVLSQLVQYLVLVPLTAMAALGLYADLRLRAEGIDELALL